MLKDNIPRSYSFFEETTHVYPEINEYYEFPKKVSAWDLRKDFPKFGKRDINYRDYNLLGYQEEERTMQ